MSKADGSCDLSADDRVKCQVAGDIAHIRLNRPEKRNAIDQTMMAALEHHCIELEQNAEIVLVILSGEGAAFCAGGDIGAWASLDADTFGRHWIRDGHRALDALARLRHPVVAVVDGDMLGGGLELASCADFRIAESHIKVGQPEAGLGVIPGWSGTQRAVRRFGAQTIRRMAMFGEVFSADQALSLGLVDRVVASGDGMSTAEELATILRGRSRRALELTKMMINAAEGEERERVLDSMGGALAALSEEKAKRVDAFLERKRPSAKEDKE